MVNSIVDCELSDSISILIVDNNSNEIQKNILLNYKFESNVVVKYLDVNVGYFPALNVGINLLNSEFFDDGYTIICNNDLIFNANFFNRLMNYKLNDNVYAISPSVKTINDVYQNPSMTLKPSLFRNLMYSLYYKNYYLGRSILKLWRVMGLGIDSNYVKDNVEKNIFIGIGAIYILTPQFFKFNKSLSYPLFLYGEEAFFSMQIKDSGGVLLYKPDIEVLHSESVSTKKIPSKQNYILNKLAFDKYKKYFYS
jgi:GT2 family glycosyltransferase